MRPEGDGGGRTGGEYTGAQASHAQRLAQKTTSYRHARRMHPPALRWALLLSRPGRGGTSAQVAIDGGLKPTGSVPLVRKREMPPKGRRDGEERD